VCVQGSSQITENEDYTLELTVKYSLLAQLCRV
jgi:hypothetical protein